MTILSVMFCLGAFSLFAQVIFMREMLAAFNGNELSIGAILSSWLVGVSVGAFMSRFVLRACPLLRRLRWVLFFIAVVLSVLLPVQVYVIRIAREVMGVPVAEYATLAQVLGCAFFVFLPTCVGIGLFFPCACHVFVNVRHGSRLARGNDLSESGGGAVSRIYAWEAGGSMLGGLVLTFALLPVMDASQIVLLAQCIGFLAALIIARGVILRCGLALVISALLTGALAGSFYKPIEGLLTNTRWRSYGVLGRGSTSHLLASRDSVYQNLALVETDELMTLYGNGQVMFSFPDPSSAQPRIHFVMAQKPHAKRVVMIGGNPADDIPELLKYPGLSSSGGELVYVELDPMINEMVMPFVENGNAEASSPVRHESMDGFRFIKMCTQQFDVVLVNAPEPVSAVANRFYTLEFYQNVKRILAPDGFMHTSLGLSERLHAEAATLGATVYKTLTNVFDVVAVTYGNPAEFFAGSETTELTFDAGSLCQRSREAGVTGQYFRPEYFLGTEKIVPAKMAFVRQRLEAPDVPVNTSLHPVTYARNLVLWSYFSGSGIETFLQKAGQFRSGCLLMVIAAFAVACLGVGGLIRVAARRSRATGPPAHLGGHWARIMTGAVIAATGFTAMALEILLIFVFQSLYGYVYARIGVIVAMFMLGLVVGANTGRLLVGRRPGSVLLSMLGLEAILIVLPLVIPFVVSLASGPGLSSGLQWTIEVGIYMGVAFVGWTVGSEFPLANHLFCKAGGSVGVAAAITDASDHLGAAAGGLLMGVVLVPVLGIAGSCLVLVAVKVASMLFLFSAVLAGGFGGTVCDRERRR